MRALPAPRGHARRGTAGTSLTRVPPLVADGGGGLAAGAATGFVGGMLVGEALDVGDHGYGYGGGYGGYGGGYGEMGGGDAGFGADQ